MRKVDNATALISFYKVGLLQGIFREFFFKIFKKNNFLIFMNFSKVFTKIPNF